MKKFSFCRKLNKTAAKPKSLRFFQKTDGLGFLGKLKSLRIIPWTDCLRFLKSKRVLSTIVAVESTLCIALAGVICFTYVSPVSDVVLTSQSLYSTPNGVVECQIDSNAESFQVTVENGDDKTTVYKTSDDFNIRGLKSGENKVTVTPYKVVGGQRVLSPQSAEETVNLKATPQKIKTKKSKLKIAQGKSKKVNMTAKTDVKFKVKDPKVAKVSKDGKITGIKPGKTTVTLMAESDDYYDEAEKEITVTIVPDKTPTEIVIDNACQWAVDQAEAGKYKYAYYDESTVCPICHSKSGIEGWNCIGFVSAAFYHGGKVTGIECSNSGLGDDSMLGSGSLSRWRAKNGPNWEQIYTGSRLTADNLKKGDVLVCFSGSSYQHMALYIGDGRIADCNGGSSHGHRLPQSSRMNIQVRALSDLGSTPRYAYRYTGK